MTELQKQLRGEQQRCAGEMAERMAVGETLDAVVLSCCVREDRKKAKRDVLKLNESVQQGRMMMARFRNSDADTVIDELVNSTAVDADTANSLGQFYEKYLDRACPVRRSSDPAQELRWLLKEQNGPMTLHIMSDTLSITAEECGGMLKACGDMSEDERLLVVAASAYCAQSNVLGEILPCSSEELAAAVGFSVGVQAEAYRQMKATLDVSSARQSAEKIVNILHVMSGLLTYLVFGGAFFALDILCLVDIEWLYVTFLGNIAYLGIVLLFLGGGLAAYCAVDDQVSKLQDYYEDRGIAEKEEKLRQRELARVTWEMLASTFELPDMDAKGKIREKQAVDEVDEYDTEDDEDFMWRVVSVWD